MVCPRRLWKYLVGRPGFLLEAFALGRCAVYPAGMATQSLWQRFQQYFLSYDDTGFSLDISRMRFPDGFLEKMQPRVEQAFARMRELEAGALANPDEKSQVGHYWLRNPALAPNDELRADIVQTNARIHKFASD